MMGAGELLEAAHFSRLRGLSLLRKKKRKYKKVREKFFGKHATNEK